MSLGFAEKVFIFVEIRGRTESPGKRLLAASTDLSGRILQSLE
jgi:hypothetical protein